MSNIFILNIIPKSYNNEKETARQVSNSLYFYYKEYYKILLQLRTGSY